MSQTQSANDAISLVISEDMFSSMFSKALELLSKAFLLSSFFPCLIVVSGVVLSLDPKLFTDSLRTWMDAKAVADKASQAAIFLFAIYFLAYLVYGIRDWILIFFSSGMTRIIPSLSSRRRNRFIRKRREKETRSLEVLALPNAVVWAETGFPKVEKEYARMPPNSNPDMLAKKISSLLDEFDAGLQKQKNPASLSWNLETKLKDLLLSLHHLAGLENQDPDPFIQRLRKTANLTGESDSLIRWCKRIETRTYGEVMKGLEPLYRFPEEKDVQPTALGNVLAWSSAYSKKRYNIDIGLVLPRLQKVIKKEQYGDWIQERKTFLDFTTIFSMLCLVSSLTVPIVKLLLPRLSPGTGLLSFIGPSVVWLLLSIAFYFTSLMSARAYGIALNSALDLYRLNLLDDMRIKPPTDPNKEVEIWRELNDSFVSGKVPKVEFKTSA